MKKIIPFTLAFTALVVFVSFKKITATDFSAELLKIAGEYKTYTASDKLAVAPEMCAPVSSVGTDRKKLFFSDSKDGGTHGKKVYYLFVKNDYYYTEQAVQNEGQVIVKESHYAIEEKKKKKDKQGKPVNNTNVSVNANNGTSVSTKDEKKIAVADGKTYSAGQIFSLFIMTKKKKGTEGTDEGWVYATTDASGKTITGQGKIASCMGCHTKSTKDRMLGN